MKHSETASHELWRELRNALLRFTRARVGSRELAEDIVHDVFAKIMQRIGDLKDEERLQPWAFRIARNAIADHYRKSKPSESLDERIESKGASSQETNYNQEVAAWLPRFLEELPEADRKLLEKVELQGLAQKELAQQLGIPYSSLKSKVQRARLKLKGLLEDCCRIDFDGHGNVVDYRSQDCNC